jgi:hypothetical protein
MFVAAVERLRLASVHDFGACRFRIENSCAVMKIISNQQIDVAIAVEIGLNRCVRSTSARRNQSVRKAQKPCLRVASSGELSALRK